MEAQKSKPYFKAIEKWFGKHQEGLILGGILGFSLTAAYLLSQKRKPVQPAKALEPTLHMERYIFDLETDQGKQQVVVESSGECYAVKLDENNLGSMWQDEEKGLQWHTHDEALKPYIYDIANLLGEAFSRKGFPAILKGAYPEIIATEWKSSETLEVLLKPETDLEVFGTFLKDEVLNLADFDDHLDLMVKRAGEDYFIVIGVN